MLVPLTKCFMYSAALYGYQAHKLYRPTYNVDSNPALWAMGLAIQQYMIQWSTDGSLG